MDFETFEGKLAERGCTIGKLKRSLYRKLAEQLPHDLEIRAAGEGLSKENGSYAPVIVTAETVYIAYAVGSSGGAELVAVARDIVTGVEVTGRILRKLTIVTGADRFVVTAMSKKQAHMIAEELGGAGPAGAAGVQSRN